MNTCVQLNWQSFPSSFIYICYHVVVYYPTKHVPSFVYSYYFIYPKLSFNFFKY